MLKTILILIGWQKVPNFPSTPRIASPPRKTRTPRASKTTNLPKATTPSPQNKKRASVHC